MRGRRLERLCEVLREEVSRVILTKLKHPALGFVTVLRAEASPDVRFARVYISVMGDDDVQQRTLRVLERARGFIQNEIAPALGTRNTPVLRFKLDQSVKRSLEVSLLLKQAFAEKQESNVNPEPTELESEL